MLQCYLPLKCFIKKPNLASICMCDMVHIKIHVTTHYNILLIDTFCQCLHAILCPHLIKASLTDQLSIRAQSSANALGKRVLYCIFLRGLSLFCHCLCFCHLFGVWGNSFTYNQQVTVLNLIQRTKEALSC